MLNLEGTQDETLRFIFRIESDENPIWTKKTFIIEAKYCPMILPNFQSVYEFDLASHTFLSISTSDADNGSCGFTGEFSNLPGNPFSQSTVDGRIRLFVAPSTDISLIDTE